MPVFEDHLKEAWTKSFQRTEASDDSAEMTEKKPIEMGEECDFEHNFLSDLWKISFLESPDIFYFLR